MEPSSLYLGNWSPRVKQSNHEATMVFFSEYSSLCTVLGILESANKGGAGKHEKAKA